MTDHTRRVVLAMGGALPLAAALLAVPRTDGVFVGRAAWEVDGLLALARLAAQSVSAPRRS